MAIRIVYPVTFLAREGPTRQLYYLIKYLDREKFEPVILTISPEPGNTMKHMFEELRVPIYSLNLPPRFGGLVTGPARFRKMVSDLRPDIIHSFGFRADVMTGYFLKGFKRILSVRGYHFREYPLNEGWPLGLVMAFMHLIALKRAEVLVACSKNIETGMRRFGLKMSVIQNGIDAESVPAIAKEERPWLRQKLGLPADKKIFVSVGFLSKRKDPETAIRGFLMSRAANDGFLLFLGEGLLRPRCERLTKGHDNIAFAGFVNNVRDYLNASDFFVSSSLSEGLPNTVLEALSAGLPVCLSDIPPHREILELDAHAGLLFPAEDPAALSRTIDAMLNKNHESMERSALRIISEHLNARRMSEEYQRLYVNVLTEDEKI